jgi:hypothetical protein
VFSTRFRPGSLGCFIGWSGPASWHWQVRFVSARILARAVGGRDVRLEQISCSIEQTVIQLDDLHLIFRPLSPKFIRLKRQFDRTYSSVSTIVDPVEGQFQIRFRSVIRQRYPEQRKAKWAFAAALPQRLCKRVPELISGIYE